MSTGWGKSRFTVVHMKNDVMIIKNNTRINSISHTHNCNLLLPYIVLISERNQSAKTTYSVILTL